MTKPIQTLLLALSITAINHAAYAAEANDTTPTPATTTGTETAESGQLTAPANGKTPSSVAPSSNLNKWVPPPEVVMPSIPEIVDGVVQDAEQSQFTPAQIEALKRMYLEKQAAKAMPYVSPANPVIRTIAVNLSPGVQPPIIRLSQGQVTSIVFSDLSGDQWFIESIVMNRQNFSDGKKDGGGADDGKSGSTNLLTIEPLSPAAYGNAIVKLRGLSTPVIFILTANQKDVDMRIDAKIPGRNPDANAYAAVNGLPQMDGSLTNFLDGVPPPEAVRLSVTGFPGAEAWILEGKMYLRIAADAQYPAYLSGARSTSGIAVYQYESKKSQVTVTSGGKAVTVNIETGKR